MVSAKVLDVVFMIRGKKNIQSLKKMTYKSFEVCRHYINETKVCNKTVFQRDRSECVRYEEEECFHTLWFLEITRARWKEVSLSPWKQNAINLFNCLDHWTGLTMLFLRRQDFMQVTCKNLFAIGQFQILVHRIRYFRNLNSSNRKRCFVHHNCSLNKSISHFAMPVKAIHPIDRQATYRSWTWLRVKYYMFLIGIL